MMGQISFRKWRGYIYLTFGAGFGLNRGSKVVEWTSWDYFDQAIAIGMIIAGVYLIIRK